MGIVKNGEWKGWQDTIPTTMSTSYRAKESPAQALVRSFVRGLAHYLIDAAGDVA